MTNIPTYQPRRLRSQRPSLLGLWLITTRQSSSGTRHSASRTVDVSARARDVLQLMRAEATVAAIAKNLGYSVGAIKADITKLYAASGASNRADLLAWATRRGL